MQTTSGDRAADLTAEVLPWLAGDPVTNNLVVTVTGMVLTAGTQGSWASPADPFRWAVARVDGEIVGAAISTSPHPVALGGMAETTAAALADRLHADGFVPTGVAGPRAAAEAFAARWRELAGPAAHLRSGMYVYRLDTVIPPVDVPGAMRPAGPTDRDLLLGWTRGFLAEAHVDPAVERPEPTLDAPLGAGRMFGWEVAKGDRAERELVAMAGTSPRVAGVTRVSLVYTPAEHRRRGYAAALVAAVSAAELAAGASACMLYAEASNPTSNGVYQRIGYELVGENAEIRFC